MERLTERNPLWIDDELWERACEPDCEEIDAVYRKLKDYEDAEEQGLLLRLPCKVGDVLYFAHHDRVISSEVLSAKYYAEAENHGVFIRERLTIDVEGVSAEIDFCDIGKTVFLTREEAETKLKEMEAQMENRYLCRGKRIDNGEWVEGNLIQNSDAEDGWKAIIIPTKNSNMFTKHIKHGYGDLGYENWYRVDPSTICQCTGLKDKNGNLIWENDIANCMDAECCGYISWNESEAGFYFDVLLEDGRFEEKHIYDYQDCMEVIGNNFDNPELLEV